MTRHVGTPILSQDGMIATWPVSHEPILLFGKRYLWIRQATTRQILDDPDFNYRRLPLTLTRVPEPPPQLLERDSFREFWQRMSDLFTQPEQRSLDT